MAPQMHRIYCCCGKTFEDFYRPCSCLSCRNSIDTQEYSKPVPLQLEPCSDECKKLQEDRDKQIEELLKPFIDAMTKEKETQEEIIVTYNSGDKEVDDLINERLNDSELKDKYTKTLRNIEEKYIEFMLHGETFIEN